MNRKNKLQSRTYVEKDMDMAWSDFVKRKKKTDFKMYFDQARERGKNSLRCNFEIVSF